MANLFKSLILAVLLLVHGSVVGAAMCRHGSASDHLAARQSFETNVALSAAHEDGAASLVDKKTGANAGPVIWLADLLPASDLATPLDLQRAVQAGPAAASVLIGLSVSPLLRPPAA